MILLIVVLVNILPTHSRGVERDVSFLTDVSFALLCCISVFCVDIGLFKLFMM